MKGGTVFAVAAVITSTVLLTGCGGFPGDQLVDVRPIESGLNFLGFAAILAALILIFGRFVEPPKLAVSMNHIFVGLFALLVVVVVITVAPILIVPIAAVIAVLVLMAVIGRR